MESFSKILEQIAFNTRPKFEEHMLVVMDKSTHEEHLSQPLQLNNEQFKVAVTFSTCYNGIFNVTSINNKFYFLKLITDKGGYIQITIQPGAYEIESLNTEIERIVIDDGHYTELNYPCTIKPNFARFGSIITISTQGPIIKFQPDDSIRDLLVFNNNNI